MGTTTVRPATQAEPDLSAQPIDDLVLIQCIHAHQLTWLDDVHATVTYPVGSQTVLSVQPDGTWTLMPLGTQGPYERALVKSDRLVFAPKGTAGSAWILPYTNAIPNV
jgi:hypothetical protein